MSPAPTPGDDWAARLADLERRRERARSMGGADRLARREGAGKLTARARIAALVDAGSFTEIGLLVGDAPADALVGGAATVDGRPVVVGAEDFTVLGGSIGAGTSAKRFRLAELARQERCPLVMLLEGAGHRPPRADDPPSTRAPNDLQAQARLSGLVPLVSGVLGPSAGHGALTAPLSDFTVMAADASIFTAGPPLVRASIGEEVDKSSLGGPEVAAASGVVHNVATDDIGVIEAIQDWLAYFPSSAWHRPPRREGDDGGERLVDEILELVPPNPRVAYDMRAVITTVVDDGRFFEVQPAFGGSLLTGLAHLGGQPVGLVANQPAVRAGTIDAHAADKAAHFVQVADAFHLPLVFLTDNPGVLAGSASERAGILRHAARMFAAQTRARTVKLQVTLRKAYGFGSSAMAMNPFDHQTLNLGFPGVTFGAMPARGADDATKAGEREAASLVEAELASGYRSARGLSVDDIIDPRELRNSLLAGLRLAAHRLSGPVEPVTRTGTLP